MTFWDTFWATMWGALAGALVGAFTAWLFSRNLSKRAERHAYSMRLDDVVARIIQAIADAAVDLEQRPEGVPIMARLLTVPAARRRARLDRALTANMRVFNLVLTGEALADKDDWPVMRALRGRVIEWERIRDGGNTIMADPIRFGPTAAHTMRVLGEWRRGELSNAEAARRLDRYASPVPDTPTQRHPTGPPRQPPVPPGKHPPTDRATKSTR